MTTDRTDETLEQRVRRYALSALELPIAVALGVAVIFAVAWFGCSVVNRSCPDLSSLPWYLGGAVLGLVVGIVHLVRNFRLGARYRARMIRNAVALAIGLAPYVISVTHNWLQTQERHPPGKSGIPRIAK